MCPEPLSSICRIQMKQRRREGGRKGGRERERGGERERSQQQIDEYKESEINRVRDDDDVFQF